MRFGAASTILPNLYFFEGISVSREGPSPRQISRASAGHKRRVTREDIRKILMSAGFQ
jgi:hypothetical protein